MTWSDKRWKEKKRKEKNRKTTQIEVKKSLSPQPLLSPVPGWPKKISENKHENAQQISRKKKRGNDRYPLNYVDRFHESKRCNEHTSHAHATFRFHSFFVFFPHSHKVWYQKCLRILPWQAITLKLELFLRGERIIPRPFYFGRNGRRMLVNEVEMCTLQLNFNCSKKRSTL